MLMRARLVRTCCFISVWAASVLWDSQTARRSYIYNLELELARANERADTEEKKIKELEEELKVVGNNLQQLEVSEEKAMAREENYQKQIRELLNRWVAEINLKR